jgi:hypothetical protein
MHVARIIVDRGVPQCQPGVHVYRIVVDDSGARPRPWNGVSRLGPVEPERADPHHQRHQRGYRQHGHSSHQRVQPPAPGYRVRSSHHTTCLHGSSSFSWVRVGAGIAEFQPPGRDALASSRSISFLPPRRPPPRHRPNVSWSLREALRSKIFEKFRNDIQKRGDAPAKRGILATARQAPLTFPSCVEPDRVVGSK